MTDTTKLQSHFYIKLQGRDAPADLLQELEDITVESSLHLPDVATFVIHDSRLHWIDDESLAPGTPVQISSRLGTTKGPLFDGEIVEIEPNFKDNAQHLLVRAFDRLHRLSRGRHARSFLNVTDGDIIQKIAQEVGLSAKVDPTPQVHPYVFQANETNLVFLQRRAAALGYVLFVYEKTLHCVAPRDDGSPIELKLGKALQEFRPRMTTIDQVSGVTARGWDPDARREIVGQARDGRYTPQVGAGQSGGSVAQKAFQLEARDLVADRPIRVQAAADLLAQAVSERHAGRFVEAEGRCEGEPRLTSGMQVRIDGVGKRFGGSYFVTSVLHTYQPHEGYSTYFTISGLNLASILSALIPDSEMPIGNNLVIGVVTDNQDPEGQGRVKVKYPWLTSEHASHWARVVSVGAGPTRGIEFLPEINDEVLVGFELGDIHYPYILGGLWNGKDAPPKKSTEIVGGGKVRQRVIQSRTGHVITLDDDDAGGGIIIKDKNGNIIKIDTENNKLLVDIKGDISVKAQGDMTMEAQGKVTIKGQGVKIDGGGSTVDVKGTAINLN